MEINKKRAYLGTIRKRYKKASPKSKQQILDELCAICDCNCKYTICHSAVKI